jgi:hypothetical protein
MKKIAESYRRGEAAHAVDGCVNRESEFSKIRLAPGRSPTTFIIVTFDDMLIRYGSLF